MDFLHSRASVSVSTSEILRVLTSSRCPYREMDFFIAERQNLLKTKWFFGRETSAGRRAPTKDFLGGLQGNSEFLARKRASRLAKTRFEPKSFSAATFFTKRLLSCAILGKELASFIHSAIGSSQPVRFCSRRVDCSSSDFFSLNNFDFSNRYVSRSMSCFK